MYHLDSLNWNTLQESEYEHNKALKVDYSE